MGITSLQPLERVFTSPPVLLPTNPHFRTYVEMFETVPLLPRYLLNSLIISISATFLALLASAPAGYALSRFRFSGRKFFLFAILTINLFSPVIILIPLFQVLKKLHLLNTYPALILPGTVFVLPFCIWLLTGYFEKIPKELEEAAFLDGGTLGKVQLHIVFPLALPGLITAASYAFISSWGHQFIFALAFNTVREIMPITQGLYEYFGQNIVYWNQLMAASLFSISPVLLIFVFFQKRLVSGMVAGAIKG
jgi:multiple sugar transport system permease protein